MTPKLPSYIGGILAVTMALTTPVPSYAMRGQEAAQTGLEEQLRKALRSPDDLVNTVSTALGLNPTAHPEPSRKTGLEEVQMVREVGPYLRATVDEALARIVQIFGESNVLTLHFSKGFPLEFVRKSLTKPDAIDQYLRSGTIQQIDQKEFERQVRAQLDLTKDTDSGEVILFELSSRELYVRSASYLEVHRLTGKEAADFISENLPRASSLVFSSPVWVTYSRHRWPSREKIETSLGKVSEKLGTDEIPVVFYNSKTNPDIHVDQPNPFWPVLITRPTNAAGLEEIQVMTVEELEASAAENPEVADLARRLEAAGKAGVALLPKDQVDGQRIRQGAYQVKVYAHERVRAQTVMLLPTSWSWDGRMNELDPDPARANKQLQTAARTVTSDQTVVVGLDARQPTDALDLADVKAVKILFDPDTMNRLGPNLRQISAFLSRPDLLKNVVLDLTSGSVRVVTIQDTEYYALDIAV